jgi:hypothetical protein
MVRCFRLPGRKPPDGLNDSFVPQPLLGVGKPRCLERDVTENESLNYPAFLKWLIVR